MANIRITRGNDFTVRVTVYRLTVPAADAGTRPGTGPEPGPVTKEITDLSQCTDLHVDIYNRLGNRTHKSFTVDGSRLLIDFDEQTPSGTYGLEVTGRYPSGKDWRFTLRPGEFLAIVENTVEGSADTPPADNVYDVSGAALAESMTAAEVAALKAAMADAEASVSGINDAEAARVESEAKRADSESDRVKAESARAGAETERAQAEAERIVAEAKRQAAELIREANEADRQAKPYCLFDEIEDAAEINNAVYEEVTV